jgi:ketosteroid isomerase-like protein
MRCLPGALRLESDVMPTSLSRQEIDHIRQLYRLFTKGDPAFLDLYEPDATLVFPDSLPNGGTYGSPLEALEFWNSVGDVFEGARPEPEEFIRDGDRVIVLGHFHGRAKATGKLLVIRFAHVFGVTDTEAPLTEQRFAYFELIIDSAVALSAVPEPETG